MPKIPGGGGAQTKAAKPTAKTNAIVKVFIFKMRKFYFNSINVFNCELKFKLDDLSSQLSPFIL